MAASESFSFCRFLHATLLLVGTTCWVRGRLLFLLGSDVNPLMPSRRSQSRSARTDRKTEQHSSSLSAGRVILLAISALRRVESRCRLSLADLEPRSRRPLVALGSPTSPWMATSSTWSSRTLRGHRCVRAGFLPHQQGYLENVLKKVMLSMDWRGGRAASLNIIPSCQVDCNSNESSELSETTITMSCFSMLLGWAHPIVLQRWHQALAKLLEEDHADATTTLPPQQAIALSNHPKPVQDLEVFVWRWMGILINVPAGKTQEWIHTDEVAI